MSHFCEKKSITREFSVAITPQQNGVTERRYRTLIEAVRTMLADSKLPTTFWTEAVNTACYVQNKGYTQEEGIDYDEVFAPIARIKAIRLFLAYDSFKDFVMYPIEGSEGFYQIVDFLNASHIRYDLTKNPTIYVSLINQFWQTATARTLDNGEIELTATIDGKVKIVTEASVRSKLQLSKTQMGPVVQDMRATNTVTGLEAGQCMTQQELMVFCTTLSKKVESLETDLKQTKQVYGVAYTKLIKKVKKLEKTAKSSQARRRTRIVISNDEDDLEDHVTPPNRVPSDLASGGVTSMAISKYKAKKEGPLSV
ncbi:xylulose kinase-1 [Tanacetum coccineum]